MTIAEQDSRWIEAVFGAVLAADYRAPGAVVTRKTLFEVQIGPSASKARRSVVRQTQTAAAPKRAAAEGRSSRIALLAVIGEDLVAGRRNRRTVLLKAAQDHQIAFVHQRAAISGHILRAGFLLFGSPAALGLLRHGRGGDGCKQDGSHKQGFQQRTLSNRCFREMTLSRLTRNATRLHVSHNARVRDRHTAVERMWPLRIARSCLHCGASFRTHPSILEPQVQHPSSIGVGPASSGHAGAV
jgi:hypothetical protein